MNDKPGGLKGANHPRHGAGRGPAPSSQRPAVTPPPGATAEEPVVRKLEGEEDAPPPVTEPPVSRETTPPADVPLDEEAEDRELDEEAGLDASEDEGATLGGGLFSTAELAEMRKGAAAKVEKDKKATLKLELMEQFEDEERQKQGMAPKRGPADDNRKVGVTIGLPPFGAEIVLDNTVYFNGHTYEVTPSVFASLVDQMQHSWRHEDEIGGHLNEPGRRERDTHIRHGVVQNGPITINSRTSMSRH